MTRIVSLDASGRGSKPLLTSARWSVRQALLMQDRPTVDPRRLRAGAQKRILS